MFKPRAGGYFISTMLVGIPRLFHVFSTRKFGDMCQASNRSGFVQQFGLSERDLVWPQQVHGDAINVVNSDDCGKIITNTDGLIWQKQGFEQVILALHVADCVPIIMVDPVKQIIAAVHAGWRGTLLDIAGKVIEKMIRLGADPKNIQLSLGPAIGSCCYAVDRRRGEKFRQIFGQNHAILMRRAGKWFLDLAEANRQQLLARGILAKHIDRSDLCTACRNNDFFSYRRDTKESFGEIIGLIGFMHKPSKL